MPSSDGRIVSHLGASVISVWPWLDGRSATEGVHGTHEDAVATLCSVRRVHDHATRLDDKRLVEDWSIPKLSELEVQLEDPEHSNPEFPYAMEANQLLTSQRSRVRTWIDQYRDCLDQLAGAELPLVVTHGEPHAANVIHTGVGAVLIDWDTVRIAPRERDLWTFGADAIADGYGPSSLSPVALEAYRLQWLLTEISLFAGQLSERPARSGDGDIALHAFRAYLESDGDSS